METDRSRRVKREWIERGFDEQMSLYGALHDPEIEKDFYLRIEILSDVPYTSEIVQSLYYFFQTVLPPMAKYTIWVYDGAREGVKLVGSFGDYVRRIRV